MRAARAISALLLLVALLAGAPVALVRWGGDLSALSELDQTWVSDRGIFALLTLALWLLWVFFAASVAAEVIATVRGVQTARIFLARPIQRVAAGLVGALLLTGSAAQGTTVDRLPPRPPPAVEAVVAVHPPPPGERATTAEGSAEPVRDEVPAAPDGETRPAIVVTRGDTPWGIAEAHLGDGLRWREIWALNQDTDQPDGRRWTDPGVIVAGWRLVLPEPPQASATSPTHLVAPGESLSSIAAAHLGTGARATELWELNRGRPQPGGATLTDPDLIQPGWTLLLPPANPATMPPPPPPHAPPPPSPPPDGPPAEQEPPPLDAPSPPPTTTIAPATPSAPDERETEPTNTAPSGLTAWLASGGALILATALVVRLRRRWRRRVSRNPAAPGAGPTTGPQRALLAAADVPLVQWAGQALAALMEDLEPSSVTGGPVLVELSDEAGIEVLWDAPQHLPPGPWTEADDGWTWRLAYDAEAEVPPGVMPVAMPALVTIGHRQGRHLLLDLEAYGTIGVDGPGILVDEVLRSIAMELAAGEDLSDADVVVVGDDPSPGLERLRAGEPGQASTEVVRFLARSRDSLASGGWTNTFVARASAPVPGEAGIVILSTNDGTTIGRSAVPRRQGVAVVGRNIEDPAARITLHEDGTARLDPLGVDFVAAVGLTSEVATALGCALDEVGALDADASIDAETAADIVRSAAEEPPAQPDGEPSAQPDDEPSPTTEPEHAPEDGAPELLVQVLGVPAIGDRPDLGRRDIVITAFLACRGGPVAASAVQDAVWGDKPIEPKTLWNAIGQTRRALGDLPSGHPAMPSADRAHSTLALADGVVTDLGLLRRAVREAEGSSSSRARELLRGALELVQGPPFDGAGFDWAYREQLVHDAGMLIETAAEHLVGLALEQGDIDGARDAVGHGLRGLPGNESLYRLRMRAEAAGSNLAGVKSAFDELTTYLADFDAKPSEETEALYRRLIAGTTALRSTG